MREWEFVGTGDADSLLIRSDSENLIDGISDHAITLAGRSFQTGAIENLHAPAAVLNQPFLQQLARRQSDAVTLMAQHVRNMFLRYVEAV